MTTLQVTSFPGSCAWVGLTLHSIFSLSASAHTPGHMVCIFFTHLPYNWNKIHIMFCFYFKWWHTARRPHIANTNPEDNHLWPLTTAASYRNHVRVTMSDCLRYSWLFRKFQLANEFSKICISVEVASTKNSLGYTAYPPKTSKFTRSTLNHTWLRTIVCSLIPRPCPAFCRFQYGKAGDGLVSFLTWVTSE